MKRSKFVALVLMGALVGCSSAPEEIMFKSGKECVDSGQFSAEECARFEEEAKKNAPKFASREECVAQYGEEACVNTQKEGGGGGFWMPMMAGFLAGHLLGGGMSRGTPVYNDPKTGQMKTPGGTVPSKAINRGGFFGSRSASS